MNPEKANQPSVDVAPDLLAYEKEAAVQRRENRDPQELFRPIPLLILGLISGMVIWAVVYIVMMTPSSALLGDRRDPQELTTQHARQVDGEQIFQAQCSACHQSTGLGMPGAFPPLAGSEWVVGREDIVVSILLHGITGPIDVKGTPYNSAMPSFQKLTDEEIAAIISFIRTQWGNTASPVSTETVAKHRAATANRTEPYSGGDELKALAP